ncbi:class I SAM-dependent methyltransferase [Saxibacter everestensis]|uniref:Class I SAM-dependent methyltransferase n=1 Tax=Saxibacter everestensis TaxID=2909229 RepID=A0ABY8QNN4_9MICO|nr:class I SAM-dependent methyltransferase [Brevibacteriaceae bacterium ZFBP1038]
MPDPIFNHRRLAEIYDPLDPERDDLEAYLAIIGEFGAGSVLDVGCGTGTLACMLAERGLEVIGVDPAGASLDVARKKPMADRVRWLHGDATNLPALQVDVALMTANVAQVFLTDEDFSRTLRGIRSVLRPNGRLVFEIRDPAVKAWQDWNRDQTFKQTDIPGVGPVESWCDLVDVSGPLVSFRWNYAFASDGAVITSDSTLRFRERDEVTRALNESGFVVDGIRDAPDRPGREFVFVASLVEQAAGENGRDPASYQTHA